MGFYLNGCGCTEHVERRINYEGDVNATIGWGFDGVKIDSCGADLNMTLYGELFNKSGRPIIVENCHQGRNFPDGGNPDQMGKGWCPYNLFRTSGDITNLWDRVMDNLMSVTPFLSTSAKDPTPLSRPGCWAYPDMLEVGRMPEHNVAESRSHFSAWAIVSAPLVLGFDLANEAKMKQAWPIVSNKEVLGISQTWVQGVPSASGRLVKAWQAPNVPTVAMRGSCVANGCVDKNSNCTLWAKENQCTLNPMYMDSNCPKSCGTCPHGDYKDWVYNVQTKTLRVGKQCMDADGQLPPAVNTGNVLHTMPCVAGKKSQQWELNATEGGSSGSGSIIKSVSAHTCLGVFTGWLWNYKPVVSLGACGTTSSSLWTLNANRTLQNVKYGCAELSASTGCVPHTVAICLHTCGCVPPRLRVSFVCLGVRVCFLLCAHHSETHLPQTLIVYHKGRKVRCGTNLSRRESKPCW